MFSHVSACPQGVSALGPRWGVCHTPWPDTPLADTPGRHTHPGQTYHPTQCMLGYTPSSVHAGIQSISARYASHWNAFLFVTEFILNIQLNNAKNHSFLSDVPVQKILSSYWKPCASLVSIIMCLGDLKNQIPLSYPGNGCQYSRRACGA